MGCVSGKYLSLMVALCFGMLSVSSAQVSCAAEEKAPQRIISMSRGVTEVLFALELGERVVGVTQFCTYPPEAKTRAKVGAYTDTNYEAIVLLKPDLVVLLPSNKRQGERLGQLGLPCVTVDMRTVDGILKTIEVLGKRCGAQKKAEEVVAGMKKRLERVQKLTKGRVRPRVLLSVDRDVRASSVRQVYLAGRGLFHDDLLKYAGGENAFSQEGIDYPKVSAEGIINMRPDVILELLPQLAGRKEDIKKAEAAWSSLKVLPAVRTGRVHVLSGEYVSVPGPRVVQTVEDMARLLHPDVDFKPPVPKVEPSQGAAPARVLNISQ